MQQITYSKKSSGGVDLTGEKSYTVDFLANREIAAILPPPGNHYFTILGNYVGSLSVQKLPKYSEPTNDTEWEQEIYEGRQARLVIKDLDGYITYFCNNLAQ